MRALFIIFLTLLGLELVCIELNQALSSLHLYLFTGGLLISSALFSLSYKQGLVAVFAIGLSYDAHASIYFGTHALLFISVYAMLIHLRNRLPYDHLAGRVVIALICNLVVFVALTFLRIDLVAQPTSMWPRVIVDIIISQIFVSLIAPWYFSLQSRALELGSATASRSNFN